MKEELLSEWPAAQNGLFFLFLFCFFTDMLLLGNSRNLFMSMIHSLFRKQDRQSIFFGTIHNEFISKLLLCLQMILMLSVFIYCSFSRIENIPFESTTRFLYLLRGTVLINLVFLLYKFLTNLWVGYVFFPRENAQLWNNQYFTIISLSGMVLFIPALLIFYLPEAYYPCFYLGILYFIFVKILMFYKIFVIFFQYKSSLLYFILYLCIQELVPLFFVSKALVCFYGM
ncbi:MAG: DUF4271 domain-containing protein [Dysgonamonadaceae bacterium]|jgi:hypothetical protein|nr:DUF4271 domain-containing protein [Dysgonamonadaceae bacterium]